MEAPPGFEPGMEVLQTSALPLGYAALSNDKAKASLKFSAFEMSPSPEIYGAGEGI